MQIVDEHQLLRLVKMFVTFCRFTAGCACKMNFENQLICDESMAVDSGLHFWSHIVFKLVKFIVLYV